MGRYLAFCKSPTSMATPAEISAFVEKVVSAMGLQLKAEPEEMPDGLRINLTGEDGSLLTRRQGEALAALQHVVAAVFRQDVDERRRLVVDCQGYRKSKDAELKQMAKFLAQKARDSGLAQEIGPLNPYERRIVHLAVAEVESVSSESIGDAFEKTVIISVK
jgi:spoIIIJ-associated protein